MHKLVNYTSHIRVLGVLGYYAMFEDEAVSDFSLLIDQYRLGLLWIDVCHEISECCEKNMNMISLKLINLYLGSYDRRNSSASMQRSLARLLIH